MMSFAFIAAVTVLSQVAEPTLPPLVPIEQAVPEAEVVVPVRSGTLISGDEEPPPASRAKRVSGTIIGTMIGDGVTAAVWVAEMLLLSSVCGFSCFSTPVLPIGLSVLTIVGLLPLGTLAGNRIAGGEVPYWKTLLGSLAGGALGGIFFGLFALGGFLSRSGLEGGIAVSVSIVPLVLAQVLSTELGLSE